MKRKALTRELGVEPLSAAIASFIDSEFQFARTAFESGRASSSEDLVLRAVHFYRSVVERLDREAT